MRNDFKSHIENKRKQNVAYNIKRKGVIEVLGKFLELIEAHKHYEQITGRVTNKFSVEGWHVYIKRCVHFPTLKLCGRINGEFETIEIYLSGFDKEGSFTPEYIIEKTTQVLSRYQNGNNNKDYKEEEKILAKIDKIIGDNSFVQDIIYYGLRNR